MPANNTIKLRQGSSSQWNNANPVLANGEPGWDFTNGILKIGNGIDNWNNLPSLNYKINRGSFLLAEPSGTFNVSGGYNLGSLDVFLNGIKLSSSGDYTASDGTSFTLTDPAPSGSVVEYSCLATAAGSASINIDNNENNRILTSTGSSVGINAESNLTFDGSLLSVSGSGAFSSGINTTNLDINGRYIEKCIDTSINSNVLTLPLDSGNSFVCNLNTNINTLTISNPPQASGICIGFTLIFTADGTARSVAWPSGVKWAGGIVPTLTSASGKKDIFSFISTNNGTDYLGFVGGQNY